MRCAHDFEIVGMTETLIFNFQLSIFNLRQMPHARPLRGHPIPGERG